MKRRMLPIALTLCLLLTLLPTAAAAVSAGAFTDMPSENHWSYTALNAAVENGLLQGDDGKLMPQGTVTRAQMAAIMTRAFGATEKADISGFQDVAEGAWYYDAVAAAVQMKLFSGASAVTMTPDQPITRQQAFTVLARALKLADGSETTLLKFSDGNEVSAYARGAVSAMAEAGYVAGSDGKLSPNSTITREQFAQIMYRMVGTCIFAAGTYSDAPSGNVMIRVPGVILKNMTVDGDLILGEGVGNGDVTLDSVTVTGNVLVRGGGANSIYVTNNTSIYHLTVCKTASGGIHIFTEGNKAEISQVYIEDGKDDIILEGDFPHINVNAAVPLVLQNATVSNLSVAAENTDVTVSKGSTVTSVHITADAAGSALKVAAGTTVGSVNSAANGVTIDGEGTVKQVTVSGSNSAVNTAGTALTVSEGAYGVTSNGASISGGTQTTTKPAATTGGGGGVSYNTATVTTEAELTAALANSSVNAIKISGSFALTGNSTLTKPVTLASGCILTVGSGMDLVVTDSFMNLGEVIMTGQTISEGSNGAFKIKGSCTNNGTITVGGASCSSAGGPNGGALLLDSGTLTNNGTINSIAGTGSCWGGGIFIHNASTLTNNGAISLAGVSILAVEAEQNASGAATLDNSAAGTLTTTGATKIEIRDGGTIKTSGSITNTGDLIIGAESNGIHWSGKLIINKAGSVNNSGNIAVQGFGANALVILGTLTNTGTLTNDQARVNLMGTLNNSGTVTVGSGAEFFVEVSAAMTGTDISGPMIALTFYEDDFKEMLADYFTAGAANDQTYAYITMGNDYETLALTENLTIPSGAKVLIKADCKVKIPTGVSMTVNSGAQVSINPDYDYADPYSSDGMLLVQGALVNNGAISNLGALETAGSDTLGEGGLITVGSTGSIQIGGHDTAAILKLMRNSSLSNAGIIQVNAPGSNAIAIMGTLTNNGTLTNSNGRVNILPTGVLTNNGTFTTSGDLICDSGYTINGAVTNTGTYRITVNTPAQLKTALGVSAANALTATGSFEVSESLTLTKPLCVGIGNTLTVSAAVTGGGTITGEDAQHSEVSTLVITQTGSYGTLAAGTYTWDGSKWTAIQP